MLRVVTPTLGKSPYLREVIAGVKALPFAHHHILACPGEKVAELSRIYPDVIVTADAGKQHGMYGAIECGRKYPGHFDNFTYINDDDLLGAEFPEYYRMICDSGESDCIFYGRVDLIAGDGARIGEVTRCRSSKYLLGVFASQRSPFNQQGAVIGRLVFAKIGGFNSEFRFAGDWEFFSRALASGVRILPSDRQVGSFRCHADQLSLQSKDFDEEITAVRKKYFSSVSANNLWLANLEFLWDNRAIYLSRLWAGTGLSGRNVMRPSSN